MQVLHRTALAFAPRCTTSHPISVLRRYKTTQDMRGSMHGCVSLPASGRRSMEKLFAKETERLGRRLKTSHCLVTSGILSQTRPLSTP
jgi:hypothetical protein